MSSLDDALKASNKIKQKHSVYLSLKDGDAVHVVFIEPYYVYESEYEGKFSAKVAINIAMQNDEGNWSAKIFERSQGFFSGLKEIADAFPPEERWKRFYRVSRKGSGPMDTRYTIVNMKELTPTELSDVEQLDLHDLEGMCGKKGDSVPF